MHLKRISSIGNSIWEGPEMEEISLLMRLKGHTHIKTTHQVAYTSRKQEYPCPFLGPSINY
jgi:hypothetical protein